MSDPAFQNMIVTLRLASTLLPGLRPTGDGWAAGLFFARYRDGPAVDRWLPQAIALWHGVPQASQGIFDPEIRLTSHTYIADPLRTFVRHPEMIPKVTARWQNKNPLSGMEARLKAREGVGTVFTNAMETVPALLSPSVSFLMRGHLDRLTEVFESAFRDRRRLGGNRGQGGTEIVGVDITPVQSRSPAFGIVSADSRLLRPVPAHLAHRLPRGTLMVKSAAEGWRPPYWEEEAKRPCMVPVESLMTADQLGLDAMIGD